MNTVFVIGAGTMGLDIAQVFAASGKSVVVRDISDDIVSKAAARLEKGLQKRVERGKMAAEAKEALLARIRFTTALEEAKDADLV
ncbi:MAG: 3-hydroxyacyl-CoA dehydrogenase NAD-binding domain-containing protein, partial [Christensenellales bacterium]|nr:3-hydroxyacyl-CoA dehydrogenase NAD-binding domain-containing protein [Christensenellales bacterium]